MKIIDCFMFFDEEMLLEMKSMKDQYFTILKIKVMEDKQIV